jgi:hypothetical protein
MTHDELRELIRSLIRRGIPVRIGQSPSGAKMYIWSGLPPQPTPEEVSVLMAHTRAVEAILDEADRWGL